MTYRISGNRLSSQHTCRESPLMRFRNRLVSLVLTATVATASAVALPAGAYANDGNVTTQEVATALKSIPGLLAQSDTIKSKSDNDSTSTATIKSTTTDVPMDASDGVTVKGKGLSLNIDLPNADTNGIGKQIAPGIIAYPGQNGSTNAVQTNEDGSVRMLTVMDSADAPAEYTYDLSVPPGGKITLTKEGGALVLDKRGKFIAFAAKPWAKDATGADVPTRFVVSGSHLTQIVNHNVSGVAYPVVADPAFSWGWRGVSVYFNKSESWWIAKTPGAIGAVTGLTGLPGAAYYAATVAAEWAINNGYCFAAWKGYWSQWTYAFWAYRC